MRVMAQGKSNEHRMGGLQPCIWPERLAPSCSDSCSLFRRITSELLQPSVWTGSWELRGMHRKHSHHILSLQHIMSLRMPALFAFPLSQREQSRFHATTAPSTSFASWAGWKSAQHVHYVRLFTSLFSWSLDLC